MILRYCFCNIAFSVVIATDRSKSLDTKSAEQSIYSREFFRFYWMFDIQNGNNSNVIGFDWKKKFVVERDLFQFTYRIKTMRYPTVWFGFCVVVFNSKVVDYLWTNGTDGFFFYKINILQHFSAAVPFPINYLKRSICVFSINLIGYDVKVTFCDRVTFRLEL